MFTSRLASHTTMHCQHETAKTQLIPTLDQDGFDTHLSFKGDWLRARLPARP